MHQQRILSPVWVSLGWAMGLVLPLAGCDDTEFHTRDVVHAPAFEDVRAVIDGACIECHVGVSAEADLDLSTDFCGTVASRALVVPGDPDLSPIYVRMRSTSAPMPPSGRLPQDELDVIHTWILAGAECPSTS